MIQGIQGIQGVQREKIIVHSLVEAEMFQAISEIFPYPSLQKKVQDTAEKIMKNVTIEDIRCETQFDYRNRAIKTITIRLNQEYFITEEFFRLKLPKIIEMTLTQDTGAFDIEHGNITFSAKKAPVSYIPARILVSSLANHPYKDKIFELEWTLLSNRLNLGSNILVEMRSNGRFLLSINFNKLFNKPSSPPQAKL